MGARTRLSLFVLASSSWACGTTIVSAGEHGIDAAPDRTEVPLAPPCATPASAPALLYEGSHDQIGEIEIDDERIYWIDLNAPNGVFSVSKCGGPATKLGSAFDAGGRVALRGGDAYWVDDALDLVREPGAGGPIERLAHVRAPVLDLSVDDQNAYGIGSQSPGSSIITIPFSGAPPKWLGEADYPWRLAVDEADFFFTAKTSGASQLAKASKQGGQSPLFSSAANSGGGTVVPGNIALDEGHVYWPTATSGLVKVAKDATTIQTLVQAGVGGVLVALDETTVYSTQAGEPGKIVRSAKSGGVLEVLATPTGASGIVVDTRSVYWVEHADSSGFPPSRIMKLDK